MWRQVTVIGAVFCLFISINGCMRSTSALLAFEAPRPCLFKISFLMKRSFFKLLTFLKWKKRSACSLVTPSSNYMNEGKCKIHRNHVNRKYYCPSFCFYVCVLIIYIFLELPLLTSPSTVSLNMSVKKQPMFSTKESRVQRSSWQTFTIWTLCKCPLRAQWWMVQQLGSSHFWTLESSAGTHPLFRMWPWRVVDLVTSCKDWPCQSTLMIL